MKFLLLSSFLWAFFAHIAHANFLKVQPPKVMKIRPGGECNNLTGIWQGNTYDPSMLFYSGGPWAVTVYVSNRDGKVYGALDPGPVKMQRTLKGKLWAECHQGIVTKTLFLSAKRRCGAYAPTSVLVTPSLLILYLHWENAMIGTNFLLVLHKRTDQLTAKDIHFHTELPAPQFQTCH